jgi:hypothetical protein
MKVKLVPLAERLAQLPPKPATAPHPHEGQPFHQKGKDLPTQFHGGPVQVRRVDPAKIDPQGRGSAYGKGFYTVNSTAVAKARIQTKNTWYKRTGEGEITVKKAHPDANILRAGEKEENSHPALVHAVKQFSPKYAKVGDMGMGDMTWKHQVNKFAEHHGYDAIRFDFNHPAGYPEHGKHTVVWKNHGGDKLVHVNKRVAKKKGMIEGHEHRNDLDDCIYCTGSRPRSRAKLKRLKDTRSNRAREVSLYKALTPKVSESLTEGYDYSCVMVDIPEPQAGKVKEFSAKIPDKDMPEESAIQSDGAKKGGGRETEIHVTALFGLHTNSADEVRKLLENEPPIKVKLGKTGMFPASEKRASDVLWVGVTSPDLHRINKKLRDNLEFTSNFTDYKPHLTVAYLKPGAAEKYTGKTVVDGEFVINELVFSSKSGKHTIIKLKS